MATQERPEELYKKMQEDYNREVERAHSLYGPELGDAFLAYAFRSPLTARPQTDEQIEMTRNYFAAEVSRAIAGEGGGIFAGVSALLDAQERIARQERG